MQVSLDRKYQPLWNRLCLFIDIFSVTDRENRHGYNLSFNGVNDAIGPDTQRMPPTKISLQFLPFKWVFTQTVNRA